ncbi:MAG TPA: sigma-70 family RNA polymerase sigma factor [Saprospiraceae bacterium]|nr:sigma-70 family RNA polymerase sigma factor [Saprospiraceae bacterium]HMQ83689.1 sigma-70 family RNA polymerase sigma factor [Saprospiraceae bacterium]
MPLWQKNDERISDEDLIALYKKRLDASIVGILFRRHYHKVYGLCLNYLKNAHDGEDAVMEIFESLPGHLVHHSIQKFEPWLFFVTRNHCLKRFKKQVKNRWEDIQEINEDFFVEIEAEKDHIYEQRYEALGEAIDELKEDQKKCIILFFLQQKTYNDIVEITGFSYNDVKSYIQNGKRNLKNYLLNLNENDEF